MHDQIYSPVVKGTSTYIYSVYVQKKNDSGKLEIFCWQNSNSILDVKMKCFYIDVIFLNDIEEYLWHQNS